MKFKYSVIGDNTAENRKHLKDIGYVGYIGNGEWIVTNGLHGRADDTNEYMKVLRHLVCCVGNDNLFRAVSAMRDNSDFMQWFTDGEVWKLCLGDKFSRWCHTEECENIDEFLNFSFDTVHKATLEELQEHLSDGLNFMYSNHSQPKATDKYTYCNHFHELTEDHEIVNLGDQDVVVNKEATILLKELNRLGLKTRSHHVGDNECFLSILLDNTSIEVREVNERDSTRDIYNGKNELLIQWKRKKDNQAME